MEKNLGDSQTLLGEKMVVCPFVNRLCTIDCVAYSEEYTGCMLINQLYSISYGIRCLSGIPGQKKQTP